MKIYKYQDFKKLPAGTIFSYFDKTYCDIGSNPIHCKLSNGEEQIDFVYQPVNCINTDIPEDHPAYNEDCFTVTALAYEEILHNLKNNLDQKDYPLGFDESGREGLFDDNNLYIVYSKADVLGMVKLLLGAEHNSDAVDLLTKLQHDVQTISTPK